MISKFLLLIALLLGCLAQASEEEVHPNLRAPTLRDLGKKKKRSRLKKQRKRSKRRRKRMNRNGQMNDVIENHICLDPGDKDDLEIINLALDFGNTNDSCANLECERGCCRYHTNQLKCDTDNSYAQLPCICSANTNSQNGITVIIDPP